MSDLTIKVPITTIEKINVTGLAKINLFAGQRDDDKYNVLRSFFNEHEAKWQNCDMYFDAETLSPYRNDDAFWTNLFDEVKNDSNSIIFLGISNKEMIESFVKIAQKPEYEGIGAYFVIDRDKNNQLKVQKWDLETMQYRIKNNLPLTRI